MSVGDRWWDSTSAPAADTGSADTGATAPSKPTVQDLGNGYSLVTYTDDLGMPKSQIVPNKDAASVAAVEAAKIGAGAAGVSASISANAANQRAAIQAEIDRARLAADQAHNAALEALAQGNAAEARRQFDISSQETQRYHSADISLRQQDQDLAKAKFGQDVYDKLANLASNPRNYMEQFFRFRGQTPPTNSAQYGNTSVAGPGLMTSQQFIPNFLRSTGLSTGAAASPPSSAAAPTSPVSSQPTQTSAGGLAGSPGMQQDLIKAALAGANASPATYTSNNMTIPGTGPKIGDVAGANDSAVVNGSRITGPGAGALAAGGWTPQPNLPENTQIGADLREDRNLRQFAGGGTLRMNEPHAIVNLLSGKVAAIAGEQPGRGPHGFVPETAKFSGQAYSAGYDDGSDWTPPEPPPDPFTPIPVAGQDNVFAGSTAPSSTTPSTSGPDTSLRPTSPTFTAQPASTSSPAPTAAPGYSSTPTPGGYFGTTEPMTTEAAAPVLQDTSGGMYNRTLQQYAPAGSLSPGTTAGAPINPDLVPAPFIPTPTPAPSTGATPTPVTTGPSTATPLINPTGSNAWGGPVSTPNVPSFLDNFMQTPSGLGRNPQFLPETSDPITNQMIQAGSFPPFLQRIFAQQKGLAGLGTNVPQQTNLPEGVPLVSNLALTQMSPSELAAFQSFVSSHGMDWNDYLALVKQASPEGGPSNPNPAIPSFLGQ